jgi:hypothetical protein
LGECEAKHVVVKTQSAVEVGDLQMHVADPDLWMYRTRASI